MPLAQNDDVIETFAAQGSDHSLRVRILPGTGRAETTSVMPMPATRRRNTSLSIASRSLTSHLGAVSSGTASMSCCAVRAAAAFRRWCASSTKTNSNASGEGGDREEVHRDLGCCVIGQERAPCLGGWTTPLSLEQSRCGPFRDLDAHFAQFAMDSRSSPWRIRGSHFVHT
jgi:hypothetical protein